MLIDAIMLHVASLLSGPEYGIFIFPEYSHLTTPRSSEHIVDYLVLQRPSKFSGLLISSSSFCLFQRT